MNSRCVLYKDVWVAPASQLYEVLTRKEKGWEEKALKLYTETKKRSVDKWMWK